MSKAFPVVIHHNPNCGTSRNVVAMAEAAGHQPQIVEYLKTGWTKPQLKDLLARMDARPRDILRTKGALAGELGLLDDGVSDEALLDAMIEHPILVERPIVATPKGVRLCRPGDKAAELF